MSAAIVVVLLLVALAGGAGGLLLARCRPVGPAGEDPRSTEPLFFARHRPGPTRLLAPAWGGDAPPGEKC
jgi:hypothetical protein